MNRPSSTYRLQINERFDLDAAAGLVDYLRQLGVGWIYLSPLLAAERGSDHGYDVVDHATVDPARGGPEALRRLAQAAHAAGLGVLVDIVPNHVGVATPADNAAWWQVLMHGRATAHADTFDIDWEAAGGKLRLPILGDEPEPDLELADGELHYHGHRLPLAPGTDQSAPLPDVLAGQHYELVNWRRADDQLNYRRFFAVSSLAAIRVERSEVFERSHGEIRRWFTEGLVDGLRVDHPDGLADPARYFDDLRACTGAVYVVAEKILEGDERLPPRWNVDGTTGYDALGDIDRVLIDAAGQAGLDRIARRSRAESGDWGRMVHDGKRAVADGILRSEVLRLAREVARSGHRVMETEQASSERELADALAELLACFPVYRSYLPYGIEHLRRAAGRASGLRPDLSELIDRLAELLGDPSEPAAIRFQQTSGMVMAKGVEDRAFYRYPRLGSLTEVGGDPSEFSIDVAEFHARQLRRLDRHPASLTTLSTHDTKRSEDARARIDVLAELPHEWETAVRRLHALSPLPDPALAELVWQAAIGAWPIERPRLAAYALKAAREAATVTTWNAPDDAFEAALAGLVGDVYEGREVTAELERMVELTRRPGWVNSLSAKLLQLTMPGVPDVYQGTELWDASLVDPDNRRPVDFARRRALLADLSTGSLLPAIDAAGAAKLLVTTTALRYRRDRAELFTGYSPLLAEGPAADHVVAFDRGGAITLATRLPIGFARRGGWGTTMISLDGVPRVEAITRRPVPTGTVPLAELLDRYPVALLVPADSALPGQHQGGGPRR